MRAVLDPILYKDLAESKAALARHGIVIIRSVETELGPAMMDEAKNSIASSPGKLREMDEAELDRLMEDLRKAAMKSSKDLAALHTRLLAQLGTEYIGDLVKELDAIGKLFTWDRVTKAVDPVNKKLAKAGFETVTLPSAEAVSNAFALELNEKWPAAFVRFKELADRAAKELKVPDEKPRERKKPSGGKRKSSGRKKG